jgi:hypothetical protein
MAIQVKHDRALSQYVSNMLTAACKRDGVVWRDDEFGGPRRFPAAVIDKKKSAG